MRLVPAKKNNHFVPQGILRRYSADGSTVSLYHFASRRKIIGIASIRDQCSRDYFYGRDPALEDSFSVTEGKFLAFLQTIEGRGYGVLSLEEKIAILLFMHYQRLRTAAAADKINNENEALLKELATQNPETSNIDPKSYRIQFENQQIPALKTARDTTLLAADLAVKFLVNEQHTTSLPRTTRCSRIGLATQDPLQR